MSRGRLRGPDGSRVDAPDEKAETGAAEEGEADDEARLQLLRADENSGHEEAHPQDQPDEVVGLQVRVGVKGIGEMGKACKCSAGLTRGEREGGTSYPGSGPRWRP